ncbi:hypothetical protein [Flammeovirga aprica]|uniref:Uncharacterized protein n=1 Tax=Flammeovirga aprica JL-4 TaxID=694437 RepID=A0A7X9RX71_9BACT|nr:hypothetical protein [Flammeovirga aprica]NME70428.1 hypothetical protein [Flammeovirga aprica JL-4]
MTSLLTQVKLYTVSILSMFLFQTCAYIDMDVPAHKLVVEYGSDDLIPIFHKHVERFIAEADKRNYTFRNKRVKIQWDSGLAAYIHGQSNVMRDIKINPASNKLGIEHMECQLIVHELFHSLCQDFRGDVHDEKEFIEGTFYFTSLMVASSTRYNFPTLDQKELWDQYFDTLFR